MRVCWLAVSLQWAGVCGVIACISTESRKFATSGAKLHLHACTNPSTIDQNQSKSVAESIHQRETTRPHTHQHTISTKTVGPGSEGHEDVRALARVRGAGAGAVERDVLGLSKNHEFRSRGRLPAEGEVNGHRRVATHGGAQKAAQMCEQISHRRRRRKTTAWQTDELNQWHANQSITLTRCVKISRLTASIDVVSLSAGRYSTRAPSVGRWNDLCMRSGVGEFSQ